MVKQQYPSNEQVIQSVTYRANTRRLVVTLLALTAVAAITGVFVPAPAYADEIRDQQWYLDALQIDKVHELSQGEGVTIGVIDSGIDADHPDLKGNVKAGKSYGSSTGDGLNDSSGHGTSVSSLIVGHGHGKNNVEGVLGIAPKAKVISVSVDATVEANYDIAEAIKWLVDQDVDIISISMSASPTGTDNPVQYARKNNVAVVASAGNVESDPYLGKTADMGWPAYDSGAIPVSGTDKDGEFWDGSVDLKSASPQPKNGIAAPAVDLVTAKKGGGYQTHDGTSGSAPLVAGTIALVKSAYPQLEHNHILDRALITADDKGKKGYDDKYGWGVVNPYQALTADVEHEKGEPSTKDDIVPLKNQGHGNTGKADSESNNGKILTAVSSSSTLPITITFSALTAVAVLTASLVIWRRKIVRSKSGSNGTQI